MKTTKDLTEQVKEEIFVNLLKENIKHEMMIKHLEAEIGLTEDKEIQAKLMLKIKQTKDGIEANKRFIKHNE